MCSLFANREHANKPRAIKIAFAIREQRMEKKEGPRFNSPVSTEFLGTDLGAYIHNPLYLMSFLFNLCPTKSTRSP